jgi:hypothetical protein
MVDVKRKKLQPVSKRKKPGTGKTDRCSGCDLNCSTCQLSGLRVLRQAVCRTVRERSEVISNSLVTNAAEGDVNCMKNVLLIMEKPSEKEGTKKIRRCRSVAMELAAELEWIETVTEETAETDKGSREPEG